MELGKAFLGLGLLSTAAGVYCMVKIMSYLSSKGEKVSFFLFRLKWFSYMSRYRELTVAETGNVGRYHRGYIFSMLAALFFVITGALFLGS